MLLALLLLLQSTPAMAKSYPAAKVKTKSARMYKSTKSKKTYKTLKKGTKVKVLKEGSKWIMVKVGSKTGYIQKKQLVKVKVTKKTTKPAAKLRTLKQGSKGTAVKRLQARLASGGYLKKSYVNGRYGSATAKAVRQFQLINGLSLSSKASVAMQKKLYSSSSKRKPSVSAASWGSSGINSRFPIHGGMATIVDVKTGTRIRIRRLYGSNHCDVEPATKSDTAKLKKLYGGKWSWNSRGVLLIAGGKTYAAAINSMPHGGQISRTNGYPGQFCLHLNNCKTHGSNKVNTAHQTNIRKVYNYMK